MAAVCCPSTVTVALPGSHRPDLGHSYTSRSSFVSLGRPCSGLKRDLKLSGKSSQRERAECRGRVVVRRLGGVRAGLPVISSVPVLGPLANAVFNPVLLFIVYAAGAFRFYSGFKKTTYADNSATKISMTALWPVLFIASKAYRNNFKKAVS
uniref:Uncharacterized protein n=1 Tax=Physcomitrium patens TaxID=3218 RepID=A9RPQ7_PHYPA|nr:hypothetical protein PHYPA_001182 [Physcomitrium patens]